MRRKAESHPFRFADRARLSFRRRLSWLRFISSGRSIERRRGFCLGMVRSLVAKTLREFEFLILSGWAVLFEVRAVSFGFVACRHRCRFPGGIQAFEHRRFERGL